MASITQSHAANESSSVVRSMADWMRSLSAADHLPFSTNRAATLAKAAALRSNADSL